MNFLMSSPTELKEIQINRKKYLLTFDSRSQTFQARF